MILSLIFSGIQAVSALIHILTVVGKIVKVKKDRKGRKQNGTRTNQQKNDPSVREN